jgi:hypothetical protein
MINKLLWFLCTFILVAAVPVSAQVEKVAMRTTGVSCGSCAVVAEMNLRRLVAGVDKVTISMSQEAIMVSYEPGAPFELQPIRDVLQPLAVGILQLQISARGHVLNQEEKKIFIAGRDRFILEDNPSTQTLPLNATMIVQGTLNDELDPMELRVIEYELIAE